MKRRMPLIDEQIKELLPIVDWDHDKPCSLNAIAPLKFYAPDQSQLWYAAEYDEDHEVFLGLVVDRTHAKLDYFSLSELEGFRDSQGECVERDPTVCWTSMRELKRIFEHPNAFKRK